MINKCNNCGANTQNPRFCSRSCSAKKTNTEAPKRKLSRKCTKCDSIVKSGRHTLCDSHFQIWKERFKQEMTIEDYTEKESVRGKHPSWIHSHIRQFARSWLSSLVNLPCAKCGYDKHVELAHIISLSKFDKSTKLNVVNSEENVIQLCPNCHWEFDNLPMTEEFKQLLKSLNKRIK